MRLRGSKWYEVSGIDCLIWDEELFYGFLGKLREKKREGIFAHILGQFILDLQVIFYYLTPQKNGFFSSGKFCHTLLRTRFRLRECSCAC